MPPKVLKKWGWWILPGSRRLGHLVLILGRRADHHMIFHIFSIPFLPWVFHRRLFKVLRKKNEIHCTCVLLYAARAHVIGVSAAISIDDVAIDVDVDRLVAPSPLRHANSGDAPCISQALYTQVLASARAVRGTLLGPGLFVKRLAVASVCKLQPGLVLCTARGNHRHPLSHVGIVFEQAGRRRRQVTPRCTFFIRPRCVASSLTRSQSTSINIDATSQECYGEQWRWRSSGVSQPAHAHRLQRSEQQLTVAGFRVWTSARDYRLRWASRCC